MNDLVISRKVYFSLGLETDSELFDSGDCTIEAFVLGPIDPKTGLIMNLTDLDKLLKNSIEPFKKRGDSASDLAQKIYHQLSTEITQFSNKLHLTKVLVSLGSDQLAQYSKS